MLLFCLSSCATIYETIKESHIHGATINGVKVQDLVIIEHEGKPYIQGSVTGNIFSHANQPIGILVRITEKSPVMTSEVVGCYEIIEINTGARLNIKGFIGQFSIALPLLPSSKDEVEVLPRFIATDCKGGRKL